ncbi:MAG: hypothetical protein JRG91_16535 [Deltaproteobacteria bacterium]|nr:hypothetical protein [Deltaproteobacteria bacterium]
MATIVVLFLSGCSTTSSGNPDGTVDADIIEEADASEIVDDGGDPDVDLADPCPCTPGRHNQRIFVLSDDNELYTYDPATNTFEFLAALMCGGLIHSYSMAVDERGIAWVLNNDSHRIVNVDVNDPADCTDSGYVPASFGLFGMTFSTEDEWDVCPRLHVHSYSGAGGFSEGEDVGRLGVMDHEALTISEVGLIDYDGGELAGTRDGRLFAFAGVGPAKLVEYDKASASVIEIVALDGLSKTGASAFAFHGGDIYFFTEAMPSGCIPCLESSCESEYDACMADETCTEEFQCAIDEHGLSDECGGSWTGEFVNCVNVTCYAECFPVSSSRVSKVTHMDHDGSDGAGRALTIVHAEAPIRIVGAGSSPCVPEVPH